MTTTRPGRALAGRFVAGDKLDDAVEVARSLNSQGFKVSLDHLGEDVHDRASVVEATDDYVESLGRIAHFGLDANISVKATQLGLSIDEDLADESIERLAERAKEVGTSVTIDMEDSRFTEATIRLYEKAQSAHGNVGIAIQTYLHRTPQDLARIIPLGGHVRICKGAYVEPEEIAFQSKTDVDAAFAEMLRVMMAEERIRPAVATHDQALIDLTRELALGREAYFEFQMLYGVRQELQRELVGQGHPVRIYLPFGSKWYPYLTRRLAERPANAWFFARAVVGR